METDLWEEGKSEEDDDQMSVRFITRIKDPALTVPDSAFFVPTKLARYGLSTVINHLLNLGLFLVFPFVSD